MTFLSKKYAEPFYNIQFYLYLIGVYTLITLSILLGISSFFVIKQKKMIHHYFNILNIIIGTYCSFYLIWRYNTILDWLGFKTAVEFTKLDRMVSLHAGILLFTMLVLYQLEQKVLIEPPN
jgi:hypothetical protein